MSGKMRVDPWSNFNTNFLILRHRHKKSQGEIAEALGIKRGGVSGWEERRSEPSLYMLKRIAEYFNVTADDLLK
jgi:transcriptional regulator with XRE-family HTH domain